MQRERFNVNKNHAEVQERAHSEKATQKGPTSTNCLHWIQEGISKTFKGSNQNISGVLMNPAGLLASVVGGQFRL